MGILLLHLVLQRYDRDHEVANLVLNKYPDAVHVKKSKGRTPTMMVNDKGNAGNAESDEERNPSSTVKTVMKDGTDGDIEVVVKSQSDGNNGDTEVVVKSQNDDILRILNDFQSRLHKSFNEVNLQKETTVRLETENFVGTITAVLNERHFEQIADIRMENERHSKLNDILKEEAAELKKQLKKSQEQCDLYKTIMMSNRRKYAKTKSLQEQYDLHATMMNNREKHAQRETQEYILESMLQQLEKSGVASSCRIKLIHDLLGKEERDHSLEEKVMKDMMELINSPRILSQSGSSDIANQSLHENDSIMRLHPILETIDLRADDDLSVVSEVTEHKI